MRRRDFVKALAAVAGVALVPWHGTSSVAPAMAPQPAPPPPEHTTPLSEVIDGIRSDLKPCENCGLHLQKPGSRVCSPLCNWYESAPLLHEVGREVWEKWRAKSIALGAERKLPWDAKVELFAPDVEHRPPPFPRLPNKRKTG